MIEIVDAYMVPDQFFYKCDPEKNINCLKTECQTNCFMTTKKEYRASDQKYYIDQNANEFRPWNH